MTLFKKKETPFSLWGTHFHLCMKCSIFKKKGFVPKNGSNTCTCSDEGQNVRMFCNTTGSNEGFPSFAITEIKRAVAGRVNG